jgi:fructokinase
MHKFNTIGIGEILWDLLPEGMEMGGAPANFSFHSSNLGANSAIISAIGADSLGNKIQDLLIHKEVLPLLNQSTFPTGTVSVDLKEGIPTYIIHESVAWDNIKLEKRYLPYLKKTDAICFGTLAQRSSESSATILEALNIVPESALRVFDINLRQDYYSEPVIHHSLEMANILKLNEDELTVLREMFNLPFGEEEALHALLHRYHLKIVALTKGANGSLLLTPKEISYYKAPPVEIIDTIGAGDSFTAALIFGLLKKFPLKELHKNAAHYASEVCRHKGATPIIKPEV